MSTGEPWHFADQLDDSDRRLLAETKRFVELLSLDASFRAAVLDRGADALALWDQRVDLDALAPLWNPKVQETIAEEYRRTGVQPELSRAVRLLRRHQWGWQEGTRAMRTATSAAPESPGMAAWRRRQIGRCDLELGGKSGHIVNVPVAFELNVGCSVGCWFCSVSAPKLTKTASYAEVGDLWQETLETVHAVIGDAARWGFCYWATDPLDNPDYEKFCLDFSAILGRFPQTTTATATRDPERTRALLALSREHGCVLNRFSVLSRGMLERILDAFTPEELIHVALLPLLKDADLVKTRSGRARERPAPKGQRVNDEDRASTTACISGFLFNMVEKRAQLITPCQASDRWPKGHWVIDELHFRSGAELEDKMLACIERHMPTDLAIEQPVRLHRAVRPDLRSGSLRFSTSESAIDIAGLAHADALVELLSLGDQTPIDVALHLEEHHGRPLPDTLHDLGRLFAMGLLDEEPGQERVQVDAVASAI